MLRLWLFAGWLICALVIAGSVEIAHAQTRQSPQMSLNTVLSAVLAETGYESRVVELSATKVQIMVTIVNSKLVDRPAAERENEAAHIASTIARVISDKPEFKSIQAMHVDYVRREAGNGHTTTIDGIDFRKDPRGNFQHHIS